MEPKDGSNIQQHDTPMSLSVLQSRFFAKRIYDLDIQWILNRDDVSKTLLNESKSVACSKSALFLGFLAPSKIKPTGCTDTSVRKYHYPAVTQWQGYLPKSRPAVGSADGTDGTSAATSKVITTNTHMVKYVIIQHTPVDVQVTLLIWYIWYMIWYDMIYDMMWYDMIWYIRYDIFVNCNWFDNRWQQYSTHLHTNNTKNNIINNELWRAIINLYGL